MIDTWYSRSLPEQSVHVMAEDGSADVCVIGAGLAGLTTALELARAGKTVIVLEAERIAWGASGRNGGFVSPGYAQGYQAIEARVGAEDARILHGLSIEGMQHVASNIGTWVSIHRYLSKAFSVPAVIPPQSSSRRGATGTPNSSTMRLIIWTERP